MSLFSMFVVYMMTWWVTLFMVLPTGVRGQAEDGNIAHGTDPGAPVKSEMNRKVILTTIIGTILWAVICAIIIFRVIDMELIEKIIPL
ncbi:MAG: DUF1467 family protein [Maricaulaceae bacterium]